MSKIAMLEIGGSRCIQIPSSVSAEGIIDLMKAEIYEHDWYGKNYKLCTNDKVEITFIDSSMLPAVDDPVIMNIQSVLEENNRLTRENEKLQEKLAKLDTKSTTTEVVIV